ncbi:hypothetical protein [Mycobacterium asiaticum]|uniref:hypothetical protein n=1 Tax=Mycobacterium asiaticum TaxID=1790 RepID=UPI000AD98227|nr:hypothetical protein [Mycobacterium asiaticum]
MRTQQARFSAQFVAGAAALATAAVIASPTPAHAEPEVLIGRYSVQYAGSDKPTAWLFVPCGSDCTRATSQDGGTFVISWEFQLANGRWTHNGTTQVPCPNGASTPATVHYSFDAVTLAGEGETATSGCGGEPGDTFTRRFQLSKA